MSGNPMIFLVYAKILSDLVSLVVAQERGVLDSKVFYTISFAPFISIIYVANKRDKACLSSISIIVFTCVVLLEFLILQVLKYGG